MTELAWDDDAPSFWRSLGAIGLGAVPVAGFIWAFRPDPFLLFSIGGPMAWAVLAVWAVGGAIAALRVVYDLLGETGNTHPVKLSRLAGAWTAFKLSLSLAIFLSVVVSLCVSLADVPLGDRFLDAGVFLFTVWMTMLSLEQLVWSAVAAGRKML